MKVLGRNEQTGTTIIEFNETEMEVYDVLFSNQIIIQRVFELKYRHIDELRLLLSAILDVKRINKSPDEKDVNEPTT